jgi:hypothetical protein
MAHDLCYAEWELDGSADELTGCRWMKKSERTRRMVVMLDEDAYLLLEGLTSTRRKGTYLSDLIRRAAAEQAAEKSAEHPEEVQLLQNIEERLERIEEKLDEVGGQFSQQASRPQAGQEAKE